MTLFSRSIFICTSLVSQKPPPDQVVSLTWNYDFWRSESRQLQKLTWYRDYRIQSADLLAKALAIVVVWW